jgi:uncharacterized protein (DUF1778 family)
MEDQRQLGNQNGRSAVLIRCTRREADLIRAAARRERRTVSGYVVNAVIERLTSQRERQRVDQPEYSCRPGVMSDSA